MTIKQRSDVRATGAPRYQAYDQWGVDTGRYTEHDFVFGKTIKSQNLTKNNQEENTLNIS